MNEPWADWRTTKIHVPRASHCFSAASDSAQHEPMYNYCCVRCGISWQKRPEDRSHELRKVIFGALSIVILVALAYGSHAAAQSICLEVITDGTSKCVDVPTYHESIHSNGA